MGIRRSTDVVPPRQRLDYWQEMVGNSYVSLEVQQNSDAPFFGTIEVEPLGPVDFSEVHASSQDVHRTKKAIAQTEVDYYFVLAQMTGSCNVSQDDHRTRLDAGGWALIDTIRPFHFSIDSEFRQMVVSIPRDSLPWLAHRSLRLTGLDLSKTLSPGPVISSYLLSLSGQLQNIQPESRILLAESVINLVCGVLNENFPSRSTRTDPVTLHRERIKTFILANLREPALSVSMIAADLGISCRYVHKLFHGMDVSVSGYIRNLRLENCRRELVSERNRDRSITHIAFSWGFNSAAHFSYVFKQRYGIAAGEYRRQYAGSEKRLPAGPGVEDDWNR